MKKDHVNDKDCIRMNKTTGTETQDLPRRNTVVSNPGISRNVPTTTNTATATTTDNTSTRQYQDISNNNGNVSDKHDAASDYAFEDIDYDDDVFAAVDATVNARLT